jgi:hypothetical protein
MLLSKKWPLLARQNEELVQMTNDLKPPWKIGKKKVTFRSEKTILYYLA